MRLSKFYFLALLVFINAFFALANTENNPAGNFIKINDMGKETWKMQAFSIDEEIKLMVNATGLAIGDNWRSKAWIINADTRLPVWEMNFDNTQKSSSKGRRQFSDDIILPSGQYEVYFGVDLSAKPQSRGISGLVNELFHSINYNNRETKTWGIDIKPYPEDDSLFHQYTPDEGRNVIVKITNLGHNENRKTGFSINNELTAPKRSKCMTMDG